MTLLTQCGVYYMYTSFNSAMLDCPFPGFPFEPQLKKLNADGDAYLPKKPVAWHSSMNTYALCFSAISQI